MKKEVIKLEDGQLIKVENNYYKLRVFSKKSGGWRQENRSFYRTATLKKVFNGEKIEDLEKIKNDLINEKD